MSQISGFVLPVIIAAIIISGLVKGVGVFDLFLEGAGEGLKTALRITPSILGLMVAIKMLEASGALDALSFALRPVAEFFHLPPEIIPMFVLRPVSGSGSLAIMSDLMERFGADSLIGRIGSTVMASSETTFYTTTVYYGSVGIKNMRYTMAAALLCDFAAFVFSCIFVKLLF